MKLPWWGRAGRMGWVFATPAGVCCVVAACSQASPASQHHGDDIFNDVAEASTQASYSQADGYIAPDSPFAPVYEDATYGSTYGEGGYAALTVCAPPDASSTEDAGVIRDAEAGASQAYGTGGSAACVPFPAECAGATPCTCLIGHFAAQTPCTYPHCDTGNGFTIRCPQ